MTPRSADVPQRTGLRLAIGDRRSAAAGVALLAASAVSWAGLVGYEPPMGLPGFLAGWTLMMAAMMLPSITPLALLYRGSHTRLAAGYLVVWGAIGLLPYAAMEKDLEPALPILLALAGVYELTPMKSACLRVAAARRAS
jgi:predicted metal-binding membrane protein